MLGQGWATLNIYAIPAVALTALLTTILMMRRRQPA